MRRVLLFPVAALAALLFTNASPAVQVATAAGAAPYAFDWTGKPATPQVWTGQGGWDVLVHKRGAALANAMDPTLAQHGADCGAPPATHLITSMDQGVYICNNHVMTSIVDAGYGAIVLTPDHMADFSAGESVIDFSTTTFHQNARDYISVWVSPFADNVMAPLNDAVDLQGPPRNGVELRMCECFNGQTAFTGHVYSDFQDTLLPTASTTPAESVVTPSSVTRTQFELRISQSHVQFGLPQQNLWWVNTSVSLPWNRGVVQLMDHSYNSCKDQTVDAAHPCASGDTWHWSAFRISSAVPFTILNGDNRYLGAEFPSNVVNFPAPAPANAFLRFEAMGSNIQWSADGGRTFQAATRQAIVGDKGQIHDEHAMPYFTPIPAGTRSVVIRGQSAWTGPWFVRDPAIWASEYSGPVNQPPPPTPGQGGGAQPPSPSASPQPVAQQPPGGGEPEKNPTPKPEQVRGIALVSAMRTVAPFVPVALLALVAGLAVGLGWRRRRPQPPKPPAGR